MTYIGPEGLRALGRCLASVGACRLNCQEVDRWARRAPTVTLSPGQIGIGRLTGVPFMSVWLSRVTGTRTKPSGPSSIRA